MPEDGPQADTTQSPSPLVAMLWTLMPGPGDHFDFVLMHANSEVPANDLLTTQSEADPVALRLLPNRKGTGHDTPPHNTVSRM
jgi:hypothetical protein